MTDEDQIRKTLAEYPKAADNRDADWYASLFTEDAVLISSRGFHSGKGEIHDFLINLYAAQPEERHYKHFFSNHVIRVNGDVANVASDMVVFECLPESIWQIRTVVRHTDRLVRQPDGRWLFALKHMKPTLFRRDPLPAPPQKS